MADSKSDPREPRPSTLPPYEPPRVTYLERLEVVAVVCSPHPPAKANPGTCPTGPISS